MKSYRNSPFQGGNTLGNSKQEAGKKQEKKDYRRIVNENPATIKDTSTYSTEYTTTNKLAMQLNSIMKAAFDDYYGTLFEVNGGTLGVTLTFRPLAQAVDTNNDRRAFLPVAESVVEAGKNKLETAIAVYNQTQLKSNNFELSEYGAELLYDLLDSRVRNNVNPFKPNTYKSLIAEIFNQSQFGWTTNGTIYCSISAIDINKLVSLVRGDSDKTDNSKMAYAVGVVRPMAFSSNVKNWVITITGMSKAALEKTMTELGAISSDGDFVVTGTM